MPSGSQRCGIGAPAGCSFLSEPSTISRGNPGVTAPCGWARPIGKRPSRAQARAEQQAQACCALNTGCPRIGVCLLALAFASGRRAHRALPACAADMSLGGLARLSRSLFASLNPLGVAATPRVAAPSRGGYGARRVRMKSSQCRRIVSMPLSAMYFRKAESAPLLGHPLRGLASLGGYAELGLCKFLEGGIVRHL